MHCKTSSFITVAILCLIWTVGVCPVFGEGLKTLPGHVPAVISKLSALGNVTSTNELQLAIGLPLRDPAGLEKFLQQIYDPASPNFQHFLTPEEFTARFGPTEADYAAVKFFAQASGFQITGTHGNRLLLDVRANVADIQRAFHLNLRKFKRPNGARIFFAPDVEPTVATNLPVADVSGLSDYEPPHPKLVKKNSVASKVVAKSSGSAPTGDFLGDDFRAAYMPGTTLTGVDQSVGLLEFDGFYASDVAAYAQLAGGGRTNIAIQTVLIDHYNGTPIYSTGNQEVSLDVEMAMAMAPGLNKIIVFSAGTNGPSNSQNDILNAMAASSTVKNLCCTWGWGGGPSKTTDNIFKEMATQGQSFFNAAGDSDAFTSGADSVNGADNTSLQNAPSSSPYIIQVGGTTLTTTEPGGAWQSESVWNWGGGSGSSGGISSYYAIPNWQVGVSMANNQGSTTGRNIPDVAMNADNVYIISGGNGAGDGGIGGTSCAAPLWAGLMALVNQHALRLGHKPAGFINPSIYAIGNGLNANCSYSAGFNDVIAGDNTWFHSTNAFFAAEGYDLCTGWGTPRGTNFVYALSGLPDVLVIAPDADWAANGFAGGPFMGGAQFFSLTNTGLTNMKWSLTCTSSWVSVSQSKGLLASGGQASISLGLSPAANNLAAGTYATTLLFINQNTRVAQPRNFTLQVLPALLAQPTSFNAVGPVGGAFVPAAQNFNLSNLGGTSVVWKLVGASTWLAVSPITGTLAAGSQTNFTVSLTANANKLKAGLYKTTVTLRNGKNKILQSFPFSLSISQSIVVNGGFETGDFSGWTLMADSDSTLVGNLSGLVHAGRYGAELGQPGLLGYLSQTLPTTAGQTYLVSLWLSNPKNSVSTNAMPNEFQLQWEGATIYDATNLPFMAWTNLQFTVMADDSGSLLQCGFRDDPYYLGLDDVSVKPIKPVATIAAIAVAPQLRAIAQSPAAFNFTFDTTSGETYQAQYKTNLLQADWINLGDPILSETNTLNFSDPDIANYPQKFYRLKQVP